MFDYVMRIATAISALVLTSIAVLFFGTLVVVVLTSYSLVPLPY